MSQIKSGQLAHSLEWSMVSSWPDRHTEMQESLAGDPCIVHTFPTKAIHFTRNLFLCSGPCCPAGPFIHGAGGWLQLATRLQIANFGFPNPNPIFTWGGRVVAIGEAADKERRLSSRWTFWQTSIFWLPLFISNYQFWTKRRKE